MDTTVDPTTMEEAILSNNIFSLKLFAAIENKEKSTNMFFSSYSLSMALAMTFAGADGRTAEEMATFFKWNTSTIHEGMRAMKASLKQRTGRAGNQSIVNIANRIWLNEGFEVLNDFENTLMTCYDCKSGIVGFSSNTEAARQQINKWIENETRGKIKDLIEPFVLNRLTRLVLTNAIYFKGEWASKFDEKQTKRCLFHLENGKSIFVDTMYVSSRFKYANVADSGYESLALPYADRKFTMIILLPQKGSSVNGLFQRLLAKGSGNLNEIIGKRSEAVTVEAYIPKFKLEFQFDAKQTMKSLGVVSLFEKGKADLSGINGNKNDLFVSNVIHKAFVDVDEKGTTAAAATAAVLTLTSCRLREPQKILFKADRPFAFLIIDNHARGIVFSGKVSDPR